MTAAARTVERHFLAQDERPAHLRAVEIARLDPFLRSLLFTDGTVTRALEVQALAPVAVERLGQEEVPVPPAVAAPLEIECGEDSIQRRVGIAVGAGPPQLWAESYLIPDRLPRGFLGLLEGAPDGIGQSLQRVALESCRELLWFGLSNPPEWSGVPAAADRETIARLYRIVCGGRAAILICESFAVELRAGVYRLAGSGELAGASFEASGAAA
jgi:chorismate-pyruvate lyase